MQDNYKGLVSAVQDGHQNPGFGGGYPGYGAQGYG